MAVNIRIPTILRTHTGGEKTVTGQGATLRDLLADLESRHAGLSDRVLDPGPAGDGAVATLRRFVNVYVNDEDVRFTGGLDTTVRDGDEVTILPAVAGG